MDEKHEEISCMWFAARVGFVAAAGRIKKPARHLAGAHGAMDATSGEFWGFLSGRRRRLGIKLLNLHTHTLSMNNRRYDKTAWRS
jgi:hypothetical protein